jgi:hypothetical protein
MMLSENWARYGSEFWGGCPEGEFVSADWKDNWEPIRRELDEPV